MKLSVKQQHFTRLVGELIRFAYSKGYALTLGDAYRDPRVHGAMGVKSSYSSSNSNHKVRLAIDLNLFVDGEYITNGSHSAYKELGLFWESLADQQLGIITAWGGRFNDANHFSLEHNGRK